MAAVVRYREFWGANKRAELLQSLEEEGAAFDGRYEALTPEASTRFTLRGRADISNYADWPQVRELAQSAPLNGPVERRAMALIDDNRERLAQRIKAYFDLTGHTDAQVAQLHQGLLMVGNGINGPVDRKAVAGRRKFKTAKIARYPWKPFDVRYCYLDDIAPLFSRPNVPLQKLAELPQQTFFISRDDADTPNEGPPSYVSGRVCDYDFLRGHARFFPAILPASAYGSADEGSLQNSFDYQADNNFRPNLSPAALAWTTALGLPADGETSRLVWHHALAITYSPAYLAENAAGIRQGWPRIPLPGNAAALRASAALGLRLAALLDSDTPVPGVTTGALPPALAAIAIPSTRPGAQKDWRCTHWGNATKLGVMPGRGHVTPRPYGVGEEATAEASALLGAITQDIGMNGASFWQNIPDKVWEVHIGGYQVLKKWLSYRDGSILQRELTAEEVAHVQATARRLAAILLMGPDLDASFRACAEAHQPLTAP